MVVLTFVSDTGTFEESFSRFNSVRTDAFVEYKVGLGLFQWLRPNVDTDWDDGTCVGYVQSMKEEFSEKYFEIARISGSMAVMLSVLVVLAAIMNACMAWNMWQIIILSLLLLAGSVASSLAFIFFKSDLCNSTFDQSSCSMDEGGLVLVAGAILWLSAFVITVVFMRTLDNRVDDYSLSELERVRAREMARVKAKRVREKEQQRDSARERRRTQIANKHEEDRVGHEEHHVGDSALPPERRQLQSLNQNAQAEAASDRPQIQSINDLEPTSITVDDETQQEVYEVYVNTKMQRIDEILRDIKYTEDRQTAPDEYTTDIVPATAHRVQPQARYEVQRHERSDI